MMKLQGTLSGDGHSVIQEKGMIAEQHTAYLPTDKAISTASTHPGNVSYMYVCMYVCMCVCVCNLCLRMSLCVHTLEKGESESLNWPCVCWR